MRREDGQSSVELVAALPFLLLVVLVAVQLAVVGYGLWASAGAARAGARAAYVGGEAKAAARSALPAGVAARTRVGRRSVSVTTRVPALVPGVRDIPLRARAALDPEAGGG